MLKSKSALIAAVIVGGALAGSTSTASAQAQGWGWGWGQQAPAPVVAGDYGCCGGGHAGTSYVYKTVNKVSHRTRYHDVWRTRYVNRVHKIVHVTRIRPIVYIHSVARVHYRTVARVHNVHVWRTEYLPARKIVTSSVKNYYDCNCSY
jgi:hypothetical protein